MMPRPSSSDSRATLPRRERPVKTAALSLRSEAGSPNVFEAVRKTLTTSRALTVRKQAEAKARRGRLGGRGRGSSGQAVGGLPGGGGERAGLGGGVGEGGAG